MIIDWEIGAYQFYLSLIMTITQLEYIIAVDTYRHFAVAASHCYVTQPTLSMQIQKLEDDLDCKIFDRSKQPVVPTEIGEDIIRQARVIVHEAKMLQQMVKDKRDELDGELRIGIIPTLAPYLLPLFLQDFLVKFPDIRLRIKEMTTDTVIDNLKSGRIDAGLLVTPLQESSLVEYPLFYEEMVAFVSKNNAAFKKTYVLPADINSDELWLLEEGHCFRSQIIQLCELKKQSGVHQRFDYEAGSVETFKQQNMIRHFKSPAPVREVSIVTHRDFLKKKLVDVLKEEIINALPERIKSARKKHIIGIN